ncbi:flagellar hook-length control protein FliK [Methylobacterium sp. J-067]|uniref:flagellar hook-length control protein FliK n=1 Tax=Methylobacterium sp. J-067 TaxID=2836648 RepID=UPI00244420D9|nr:flagellar hook-length control protein FliK [Methylobacterium sp. J-067]
MALGGTDRVETKAWRSQGQRAEPAWRAADSQSSRFDAMLAKPEAAIPRKAEDTRSQDRAAARRNDKSADTRETAKARSSADDSPRAARSDDNKPLRDKAPAKQDAGDGKAADADATPETGAKPAKAAAATTDSVAKEEAAAATPTPNPVLIPIPPNPAAPSPTAQAQAVATATGEAAAVASAAASVPGAVEASGTGEAAAPTDGKGADGKDFLALLGETGAAQADAPATTAPQAAAATQGVTQTASSAPATATQPAQAPAPTPAPVPLGQVPMTIGLRSLAGSSEFQIRLDPVELGRIDVKLEIDKAKGTVATHLVVDRPDTLALLQRDAGQLQQALTQAGLDPSAGGVNVSLRGDGGNAGGQSNGQPGGDGRQASPWSADRTDMPTEAVPLRMLRGYGGLDIRI